jgi:hypothetical protein
VGGALYASQKPLQAIFSNSLAAQAAPHNTQCNPGIPFNNHQLHLFQVTLGEGAHYTKIITSPQLIFGKNLKIVTN